MTRHTQPGDNTKRACRDRYFATSRAQQEAQGVFLCVHGKGSNELYSFAGQTATAVSIVAAD
jgi:hypothetical protein